MKPLPHPYRVGLRPDAGGLPRSHGARRGSRDLRRETVAHRPRGDWHAGC